MDAAYGAYAAAENNTFTNTNNSANNANNNASNAYYSAGNVNVIVTVSHVSDLLITFETYVVYAADCAWRWPKQP